MTAHDTVELRAIARLDALPSPRSAEELRAADPSRSGPATARLTALRELARSTWGATRERFLREAQALELQTEEQAGIDAWHAANACTCRAARGHTPWCALGRGRRSP